MISEKLTFSFPGCNVRRKGRKDRRREEFKERKKKMEKFLDHLVRVGILIYDNNHPSTGRNSQMTGERYILRFRLKIVRMTQDNTIPTEGSVKFSMYKRERLSMVVSFKLFSVSVMAT